MTTLTRMLPGAALYKLARTKPDADAFRVWIVVPMDRPNPALPGMTHHAQWYATRWDDAPWRFARQRDGEPYSGQLAAEEAAELEALPVITEEQLDEITGLAAFNEHLFASTWLALDHLRIEVAAHATSKTHPNYSEDYSEAREPPHGTVDAPPTSMIPLAAHRTVTTFYVDSLASWHLMKRRPTWLRRSRAGVVVLHLEFQPSAALTRAMVQHVMTAAGACVVRSGRAVVG